MFYSLLGRQIGRHLSTSSSSPTNDGQSLTSGNCEGVLPLRHFLGSSHFPLRILPLYSSSKCSFGTDLFIIPFLVWNLTVQILPSFPGKVSTIFPSFHFPVAMFANVYMQDTFSKLALPHVILVWARNVDGRNARVVSGPAWQALTWRCMINFSITGSSCGIMIWCLASSGICANCRRPPTTSSLLDWSNCGSNLTMRLFWFTCPLLHNSSNSGRKTTLCLLLSHMNSHSFSSSADSFPFFGSTCKRDHFRIHAVTCTKHCQVSYLNASEGVLSWTVWVCCPLIRVRHRFASMVFLPWSTFGEQLCSANIHVTNETKNDFQVAADT